MYCPTVHNQTPHGQVHRMHGERIKDKDTEKKTILFVYCQAKAKRTLAVRAKLDDLHRT